LAEDRLDYSHDRLVRHWLLNDWGSGTADLRKLAAADDYRGADHDDRQVRG
jgi:hypothetical protein